VKSRFSIRVVAVSVVALAVAARPGAQDHDHRHHHYQLIELGTFGGPSNYLVGSNATNDAVNRVLNNQGTVVAGEHVHAPAAIPSALAVSTFADECVRETLSLMSPGASSLLAKGRTSSKYGDN